MADVIAIPVGIDDAEEFGQNLPPAPPGWNELTVLDVEMKTAQGKGIHEVHFVTANGEEAERAFFLNAEAIGYYIAFLRMIAPDVPKFAGLDPRPVLKGRRIGGLAQQKVETFVLKKGARAGQQGTKTKSIVEAFRPASANGDAPRHASAPAASTASAPPPPSDDTPF